MSREPKLPRPSDADFRMAAAIADRERYERGPAKTDPAAALQALHVTMSEAGKRYQDASTADQRFAVFDAIYAVYEMLIDQGFSELTLAPLFRPIEALEAQFHAAPDKLFSDNMKKGGAGGRLKKRPDRYHRDGVLAAFANYWIENLRGDELIDATLDRAARQLKGRWFGKIAKKHLREARNLVSQVSADHSAAQSALAASRFLNEQKDAFGPAVGFAVAIRLLNDAPRVNGLGNWAHLDPDAEEPPS